MTKEEIKSRDRREFLDRYQCDKNCRGCSNYSSWKLRLIPFIVIAFIYCKTYMGVAVYRKSKENEFTIPDHISSKVNSFKDIPVYVQGPLGDRYGNRNF